MKTTTTLLVLGLGLPLVLAAECRANNCARAVTGTAGLPPPVSSKRADCSSFFRITVTPAVFTSTVYETVTPFTVTPATVTETVTDSTQTNFVSAAISGLPHLRGVFQTDVFTVVTAVVC